MSSDFNLLTPTRRRTNTRYAAEFPGLWVVGTVDHEHGGGDHGKGMNRPPKCVVGGNLMLVGAP